VTSRRISITTGVGGKEMTEVIYPDIAGMNYVFRYASLVSWMEWSILLWCPFHVVSLSCVIPPSPGTVMCGISSCALRVLCCCDVSRSFGATGDMVLFLRDGAKLEMR
jgi:hypothetical protein